MITKKFKAKFHHENVCGVEVTKGVMSLLRLTKGLNIDGLVLKSVSAIISQDEDCAIVLFNEHRYVVQLDDWIIIGDSKKWMQVITGNILDHRYEEIKDEERYVIPGNFNKYVKMFNNPTVPNFIRELSDDGRFLISSNYKDAYYIVGDIVTKLTGGDTITKDSDGGIRIKFANK